MAAPNPPPGFDSTDPDIYAAGLPTQEFAGVRHAAPIGWKMQPPDVGGLGDHGFWALSRHRNVREMHLRGDFSSSMKKSTVPRAKVTGGGGQIEAGALSMITTADHIRELTPISAPERLRSSMSNGITHCRVEYR